MKMYSGQIFALLGQNGAGKSTTIGILTGLLMKSKGAATIFDHDLFYEQDKVRQMMGVCPQHDVLFEQLTPEEHIRVF
jgi:ATP-binding cassette subfamily A (ABC1) protein 3